MLHKLWLVTSRYKLARIRHQIFTTRTQTSAYLINSSKCKQCLKSECTDGIDEMTSRDEKHSVQTTAMPERLTMKSFKHSIIFSAVAITLTTSAISHAQYVTEPREPKDGARQGQARGPGKWEDKFKAMRIKYLEMLHEKMKITPQQEAAWKAFNEATAPTPRPPMQIADARNDKDNLTAPQQLEKMIAHHKERQAEMEKHLSALKNFYAVLSPEQQKIFDEAHRHVLQTLRDRVRQRSRDTPPTPPEMRPPM
jgi:periplasmic protein CpxP/Spy